MFDGGSATATAYDTYVVDIDDIDDAPIVDQEEVMQAFVGGAWHRTLPGEPNVPACGMPVPVRQIPDKRGERLTQFEGVLCADCFTQHEIAFANAKDEAARKESDAKWARWHAESSQRMREIDERTERLQEERRRLTTNHGTVPLKKPTEGDE